MSVLLWSLGCSVNLPTHFLDELEKVPTSRWIPLLLLYSVIRGALFLLISEFFHCFGFERKTGDAFGWALGWFLIMGFLAVRRYRRLRHSPHSEERSCDVANANDDEEKRLLGSEVDEVEQLDDGYYHD